MVPSSQPQTTAASSSEKPNPPTRIDYSPLAAVFYGIVDLGRRRFRHIELFDQLCKAIRHALSDHVIVHGAELMPDPGLNLGVKPALLLYFLHVLIHASPRVKSLWFQ